MRVLLGNPAAKEAYRGPDGELNHRALPGDRVTEIVIPDSYSLLEAVASVTSQDGAWNHHSLGDNPDDSSPTWVESDNEPLASLLAQHFECPVGRPEGWGESEISDEPKGGE
jgi:hypothetical protein